MIECTESEQAVLGAILYEPPLIQVSMLQPSHFARVHHSLIFKAMRTVEKEGAEPELAAVTTGLGESINQTGGIQYLTQLAGSVATTATFNHHERKIIEAYRLRESRKAAIRYVEQPNDASLQRLSQELTDLQRLGYSNQEKRLKEWLYEISDDMSGTQSDNQNSYKTGYEPLDQMTGGLQRKELIVVAARPSMGKTAFALNLGSNHCKNEGRCLLFSLEMGSKQLLHRVISADAHIDGQKWKFPSRFFSEEDYDRATTSIASLWDWKLNMYENTSVISDICSISRQTVRENPDDDLLIVIDYLQMIHAAGRFERKDLEVGAITRELKRLATDLNVPIVILSQLSRNVENRHNKRPVMADLRDSGNIEQDADVIAFLYREAYYDQEADQNQVEVDVSKQRNGPTGTIELGFMKECGRFIDIDGKHERNVV
ncbi:replicative DNA helicase [Geomicrobium halophilum]|uniref:DNA 5'-3' helicase n=1 Tax=Geomicrobium halophilum TaxID=549000 RepID=A0A841PLV9_9BACL|nr:replicative DNA helicase [Geomicrobium halophilum]MBB6449837.1 replicative DNA helicase [Geomicrobium halophilum]